MSEEITVANQDRYQVVERDIQHEHVREVVRESWLTDEQSLRMSCLSLARESFSLADAVKMAERYVQYVLTGIVIEEKANV